MALPGARAKALAAGQKRYTGGRPCPVHGNGVERFASDAHCVQCTDAKFWRWYEINTARVVANAMRWRERNPEKFKEQRKRELPANRVRVRKWAQDHPEWAKELARTSRSNRRARKRNASGRWTREQIIQLLADQDYKCAACATDIIGHFERDHKMPLALGGSNDISNIQLLCLPCNRSKGYKHPEVWAREIGLLS